jgi:signal transduction histidine kinase
MKTLAGLGKITLLIVTMLLLPCSLPAYTYTQDSDEHKPEKKTVLLISSYHPGFPTFFRQIDGIKSVFENTNIDLDVEFMDSKRFYTETNLDNFYRTIVYKLSNTEAYDVIIVTDDNALTFVLDHQAELFENIPIVFCGVNNVDKALVQNENSYVTGVIEAVSMMETIELMIGLNPDVTNIIAIVDDTPSGQGDLVTFYQSASEFTGVEFSDISLTGLTWTEFAEVLRRVDKHRAVLLLSAYRDKTGDTLDFDESLDLITKNLGAPLYHLWYHGMGDGILGGKLISHFEQGKTAAEIALQIIAGKPIEDIPVLTESPNRYIFDYAELREFGIAKSTLPQDSIIINEPQTFYTRYKGLIWAVAFVVAVLLLLVILLSINVLKRRQVEEELINHRDHLEELVTGRTAELATANAELAQYAYVVSHDLRAPLRAIHNYASFLHEDLEDTLDGEQKVYLDGLGRAVYEAEELIEDLLKLSRLGRRSVQLKPVDLGVFLQELIASLNLPAEVEVVMQADWPTLDAESTLLRQIFQNLVENAVKFNDSSPKRVELGWRPVEQDKYEFFVRDNGLGIEPRYQQQIFRVFERLHTREAYGGTGIGLAIVKKAASKLRGSVRVESEAGEGSTFFVTLPKTKKEPPMARGARPAELGISPSPRARL